MRRAAKANDRTASELSKLSRNPRREATEESSGQPAVIVDHDAGHQLVQIWKHCSHIAPAQAFANARHNAKKRGLRRALIAIP
ncbi:hypothetical protein [Tardiphaga sp. vice154]|uniref:hypothetical protein n=1 Tax=Tardiphaga sp. vice154 TaxID=2592814 RepID=UPI00143D6208|nr:hypothetical protein [Tardiphaga sp. vice154]